MPLWDSQRRKGLLSAVDHGNDSSRPGPFLLPVLLESGGSGSGTLDFDLEMPALVTAGQIRISGYAEKRPMPLPDNQSGNRPQAADDG
jgi:hypothetical protein